MNPGPAACSETSFKLPPLPSPKGSNIYPTRGCLVDEWNEGDSARD